MDRSIPISLNFGNFLCIRNCLSGPHDFFFNFMVQTHLFGLNALSHPNCFVNRYHLIQAIMISKLHSVCLIIMARRNEVTISIKQKIIQDHNASGLSQRQLEKKYNIGKSTVQRILKNREINIKKRCRVNCKWSHVAWRRRHSFISLVLSRQIETISCFWIDLKIQVTSNSWVNLW